MKLREYSKSELKKIEGIKVKNPFFIKDIRNKLMEDRIIFENPTLSKKKKKEIIKSLDAGALPKMLDAHGNFDLRYKYKLNDIIFFSNQTF